MPRPSRNRNSKVRNPPTNISAVVRFITNRYMARVRRLRFFTKRMIDRRFTDTNSNRLGKEYSKPGDTLYSDEENIVVCFLFAADL